jgi:hypothetical protein
MCVYAQANLHQMLLIHPNIITLHQTLETNLYLLLVLEFVPGKDLFYFLEQACGHYEPDPLSMLSPTSPTTGGSTSLSSPISPTSSSSFAHTLPIGTGINGTSNESESTLSSALSHTPLTPSLLLSQNTQINCSVACGSSSLCLCLDRYV